MCSSSLERAVYAAPEPARREVSVCDHAVQVIPPASLPFGYPTLEPVLEVVVLVAQLLVLFRLLQFQAGGQQALDFALFVLDFL